VDVGAVIGQIVRRMGEAPGVISKIVNLIEQWQPDLAICDREFFLPLACRRVGLRCVALNHSGLLLSCRYPIPPGQRWSWLLAMVNDRLLFDFTRENLSVSFYHPDLLRRKQDELLPPVLRPEVWDFEPRPGNHIFVYQTSPTFLPLLEVLKKLNRPAIVYGMRNKEVLEESVQFRPIDRRRILEDLSTCAYAVTNGGHNLLCEAFFFGKPVLCFPIANLFEQALNSYYVEQLGFGACCFSRAPDPVVFSTFESQLEHFRHNLAHREFDGTDTVVQRVQEVIAGAPVGGAS